MPYLKKRITALWMCVVVVVLLSGTTVGALNFSPPFSPASQGLYLVNMNTDTVMYQQNEHQQFSPASLVKIMTAIIALENTTDLEEKVTAGYDVFNELYGRNASNAGLIPGEQLRMIDLLYGLMLKSGCDAAGVIARHIGQGDVSQFVAMMNDKAKQIGANDTVFVDAHGLDDQAQRSTPYDMYLITQYALKVPMFEEIATAASYELPPTNKRSSKDSTRYWSHTNQMLNSSSKYYNPSVRGIKTGTSSVNTKNLITMAQKDGNTYLLVLMGAPNRDEQGRETEHTLIDSNKLYDWIFGSFSMRSLVDMTKYYVEVPVNFSAENDYVLGVPQNNIVSLLPKDSESFDLQRDVETVVIKQENITAPVAKGDIVGSLEIKYQDETLGTVNLVAAQPVERSTTKYLGGNMALFFQSIWVKMFSLLLLLLLIAYIVLMILYNRKKRKQSKHRHKKPMI